MNKDAPSAPRALYVLALVGLAGAVATLALDGPARFFANWLVWFLFLLSVGLGSLFLVGLEHATGALWSVPLRRSSERLSALVVWIVPVALVAWLSLPHLFPWTHAEAAHEPMVAGKLVWLNTPAFTVRLVVSLALWILSYRMLSAGSFRQDESKELGITLRARRFAPLFLIIFAFTLTNAAFDWISSLEPLWYSDIFGVYLFAGTFLAGLSATGLATAYLIKRGRLEGVRHDHVYNLGGYLFAFTVFWSYVAFAQYMLQWYANMPEEVFWYQKRLDGVWGYGALALAVFHFAIPFLALASRKAKGDPMAVARVAVVVLVAHVLDLFWLVFPVLGLVPSWQEISFALLFVGAGLLWAHRAMNRGADMPVGDPQLQASLDLRL